MEMIRMITEGRRLRLDALNRAFEKAFSHTASRETLLDLLGCMGEELGCDRISIFELNMDTGEFKPAPSPRKSRTFQIPLNIYI